MDRRQFHLHLLLAGLVPGMARAGTAPSPDGYPDRPIRIVVPYPAGGVVDVVLRAVCDPLSNALPQRIVIENRPGADGRIGLDAVAKAPADGYTLLGVAPILAVGEHLMPEMKARSKDFVGVCGVAAPPTVFVVHDTVPARTLKEFVALAAARPGEFNAANPGTGSSIHLAQELFFERTGIRLTNVSYKGQPPALLDLGSGLLQFALISQSLVLPLIQSGKVRALAVNAAARTRSLPEVPTIAQAGYPDILVQSWYGIAAAAKTPTPVVEWLSQQFQRALAMPEVRARLAATDAEILALDAARFTELIAVETRRWGALIHKRGIRL
ncbi:tripartite tricarboxylate transporter substrate binding protein [Achromobacter mucicolens]|uniref:Argininosuccinate lyase n=1 Tax=Achromobacter aegrifaciens TaxID=1287736 RepID=A0AAD2J6M6_ACHAE|nr:MULTISPECIES: tripartite tricarboxylate transporter substrate binding protein [Achromobacter]MDG9972062.1 tripartite tricarboxylate transporter substrate binding protein [Achromobacter mucicolens]CUJ79237.1 Argininosuccinate lyase [Achromobacter aegrifaciens]